MSGYVVGADVGTSALKAALVHPDRGVVSVAEHAYPMHRPQLDWAENDPADWYVALSRAIPEALAAAKVPASEVRALCLVGQRDIAVLLDEDGTVLAPCIHWTDRRNPEETSELYDSLGRSRLIDRSGTLPIPGLVLPNLAWTKRHLPEVWRRVRIALQPKDYLAYRLTGDIGTDPTGPTRSILNDWRHQDWSVVTCGEAGIPREILPDVKYQPWEPRGTLGAAAADLGLLPGTILVAGGGDDPAAALGSGVVNPGDVSIGTGSSMSWRVVATEPRFDPTGLIGLMPHLVPGRYLHEMVATGTGTTLRWFRGVFGDEMTYEQLISEGADICRGSEGLLCFPYVEGATVPLQDDAARAVYLRHRRVPPAGSLHPVHARRHCLPVPGPAGRRADPGAPGRPADDLRRRGAEPLVEPDQGRRDGRGHHSVLACRGPLDRGGNPGRARHGAVRLGRRRTCRRAGTGPPGAAGSWRHGAVLRAAHRVGAGTRPGVSRFHRTLIDR